MVTPDTTEAQPTSETTQAPTEVTQEVQKPSPEDMAARSYMMLLPQFLDQIDDMSSHRLKRVVRGLMEYPFEKSEVTLKNQAESRAFSLGTQILDARFVMMRAFLELNQDQIKQLVADMNKEEGTKNV